MRVSFRQWLARDYRKLAGPPILALAGLWLFFVRGSFAQETNGLPAWLGEEPQAPAFTNVDAAEDYTPPKGSPVTQFVDDLMPTQWLHLGRLPQASVKKWTDETVAALKPGADEFVMKLALERLAPLPAEFIVQESWPDFTTAIDLLALAKGANSVDSLFFTVVENDRPRLVRVCHGIAGMNAKVSMWVSGQSVNHGQLVRLGKGRHPIVVQAFNGRKDVYIALTLSRLSPRFTEVTEEEVKEWHGWRVAQWQEAVAAFKTDERALLAKIAFDPSTIRGQEGFFRVGRSTGGRWWFIDPDGLAFYHRGVTGLNAGGMGGRRAKLPPIEEKKTRSWIGILKNWGFNAMGAWTTSEFFEKGMAYAETIEVAYAGAWLENGLSDVFSPQWITNVSAICERVCPNNRTNKLLIGYFIDNERGFMEMLGPNTRIVAKSPTYRTAGFLPTEGMVVAAEPKLNVRGIGLLQFCLSQSGETVPAWVKAWEFVLERHAGKLEEVGKAWGIEIASKADIRALTGREEILISEGYQKDLNAFVQLWVEQYYRVTTDAIRRHDPNHLILGCRWGATPGPAVLEAEAKVTDVVSRNNYRAEFYERFDECSRLTSRPILNGEVSYIQDSFAHVRNPIEPPGGLGWYDRREIRMQEAFSRIFSHSSVLGFTFYRWHGGLWGSNGRHPSVARPLQLANSRAVTLATAWDHPQSKPGKPLHGQVFIWLENASVSVNKLPSPKADAEPSLMINTGSIHIGLICRNGIWDKRVYGIGYGVVTGEVTGQEVAGDDLIVAITIKQVPGIFTSATGRGEYRLQLKRIGIKVEGRFTGVYNGEKAEGPALGYLFRPVPTSKL